MSARLVEIAGRADWYALDVGLDDRSLRTVARAWRLPAQRRTPGRVVAQLMFGFPMPGENRRLSVEDGHQACLRLARVLDRDLAS